MVSFVNYWYNKKNMLGELIFVVACFKEALRDFRDHPEYPGPIVPVYVRQQTAVVPPGHEARRTACPCCWAVF